MYEEIAIAAICAIAKMVKTKENNLFLKVFF